MHSSHIQLHTTEAFVLPRKLANLLQRLARTWNLQLLLLWLLWGWWLPLQRLARTWSLQLLLLSQPWAPQEAGYQGEGQESA